MTGFMYYLCIIINDTCVGELEENARDGKGGMNP